MPLKGGALIKWSKGKSQKNMKNNQHHLQNIATNLLDFLKTYNYHCWLIGAIDYTVVLTCNFLKQRAFYHITLCYGFKDFYFIFYTLKNKGQNPETYMDSDKNCILNLENISDNTEWFIALFVNESTSLG